MSLTSDPTAPPTSRTGALDAQVAALYDELRSLANSQLRRERSDHTLSATALVHEAYLKLSGGPVHWHDRSHFFGIAARAMRQILINHALARNADKRGGQWDKLTLTTASVSIDEQASVAAPEIDVVALDEALKQLETVDPRQARIVELRYFGGLSIEETATVTGLSVATIKREWAVARLYLRRALDQ
jgi:RNA polymerase sigma factor (TIGR02999 family)